MTSVSQLLTTLETYKWVILGVLLVALLVVAAVLYWRYRKRKQGDDGSSKGPSLSKRLRDIYRPFYASLSRELRDRPTVLVFGEAGAGKTHLIDLRVDYKGEEASRFLPSARGDPLLQLYPGPQAIIQELSWQLLNDITPEAKSALTQMWRKLGSGPVVVVVALPSATLLHGSPDALKNLAQRIRGKLNILTQTLGRSVEVRPCITFMDQVTGYTELVAIGVHEPVPASGEAAGDNSQQGEMRSYAYSLQPLEDYLPWTLTTQSSDDFRQVVGFLSSSPELLGGLDAFVRDLVGSPTAQAAYQPKNLYFSALNAGDNLGDPFVIDAAAHNAAVAQRRRTHLRNAALLAAGALGLVLGVSLWHAGKIANADEAVSAFTPQSLDRTDAWRRASDSLEALDDSEVLWLQYQFVADKDLVKQQYLATTRELFLMPLLLSESKAHRLYAASIIYAAEDNNLGTVVNEHAAYLEGALLLPAGMVGSYVGNNRAEWTGDINIRVEPYESVFLSGADASAAYDNRYWRSLLLELRGYYDASIIRPDQLDSLQNNPAVMGMSWTEDEYEVVLALVAAITADERLAEELKPLYSEPEMSAWARDNYQTLTSLTTAIRTAEMPPPPAQRLGLSDLTEQLKSIAKDPDPLPTDSWTLTLEQEGFAFEQATWALMLQRGRGEQWVDAFVSGNAAKREQCFFRYTDSSVFPAAGALTGTSQGPTERIDGYYTKNAYDKRVSPAMLSFDDDVKAAVLLEPKRDELTWFVSAAVTAYAQAYRNALEDYYGSFRFSASSSTDLEYELAQISGASSWFSTFLVIVRDNASLDSAKNDYLQQIVDALVSFLPVVDVMAETKGRYPKLEKYTAILATFVNGGESASGGSAKTASTLTTSLTPVGKAELTALTGGSSAEAQVQAWLVSSGLFGAMALPFADIAKTTDRIGRQNIESTLASQWQRTLSPMLSPVTSRFPFTRTSKLTSTPSDVEALLSPTKGTFWPAVTDTTAPVVSQSGSRWTVLSPLAAPKGMLSTLNTLTTLRSTLWDAKGNQLPLHFAVTPTTLPVGEVDGTSVTLAYLKVGDNVSYAFNQQPSQQQLSVQWWAQTPSSLVLEMTSPTSNIRKERSLDSYALYWSFYQLLNSAKLTAGSEVTWQVIVNDAGTISKQVSFLITPDPWAIFSVPTTN